MTPAALAALHARAFTDTRSWSASEFADLLASPHVFLVAQPVGFALGRVIADEAELLTLAVAPDARRLGHGRALLAAFETGAQTRGAAQAFLEVAADNAAARALYTAAGWTESGRRPGYYRTSGGQNVDALVLGKLLKQA